MHNRRIHRSVKLHGNLQAQIIQEEIHNHNSVDFTNLSSIIRSNQPRNFFIKSSFLEVNGLNLNGLSIFLVT